MLKKLFAVLLFGIGSISSSDYVYEQFNPLESSIEINDAILEIAKNHLKIDGRRIESFYTPYAVEYSLEGGRPVSGRFCSSNNELRLCKLQQHLAASTPPVWAPIGLQANNFSLAHNEPTGLFESSLDRPDLMVECYSDLIPDWNSVAIDPLHSQYKNLASSDLGLQQAINTLKGMFGAACVRMNEETRRADIGGIGGIGSLFSCYNPVIRSSNRDIIRADFSNGNSFSTTSFVVDDTIDHKDLQRLSKSELFAAQVYIELLKKRPQEVDGVKIMYTSEQKSC